MIRISSKSAWFVVVLVAAVPAAVQAQVVSLFTGPVENRQALAPSTAQAPSESAEAFRFPRLIVTFGVGSSSGPEGVTAGTLQTASVQFLLGRHFAVEAEASRWATTWDDGRPGGAISGSQGQQGFSGGYLDYGTRRGWSGGGNLLYRSELRRVSLFAGGGASVGRERESTTSGTLGCVAPGFQYSCNPVSTYRESASRLLLPGTDRGRRWNYWAASCLRRSAVRDDGFHVPSNVGRCARRGPDAASGYRCGAKRTGPAGNNGRSGIR